MKSSKHLVIVMFLLAAFSSALAQGHVTILTPQNPSSSNYYDIILTPIYPDPIYVNPIHPIPINPPISYPIPITPIYPGPIYTQPHVDIWLNKAHGAMARYRVGENIQIGLRSTANAYIYLFNIRSNGVIRQIFPNNLHSNNYVYANQSYFFPSQGANYSFTVDGPVGRDRVVAVASSQPLNHAILGAFRSENDLYAQSSSFINPQSIIVNPVPTQTWSIDVESFDIYY